MEAGSIGIFLALIIGVRLSHSTALNCGPGFDQIFGSCYMYTYQPTYGMSWLGATKTCFNQNPRAVPLVQPTQLEDVLNSRGGLWPPYIVPVGITTFGGSPAWIDGETNGIPDNCTMQPVGDKAGPCGWLRPDFIGAPGSLCVEYWNCQKELHNYIPWVICKYKPVPNPCDPGYELDAHGDDCFKFVSNEELNNQDWDVTYCKTLMNDGAELAVLEDDDNIDDLIWLMRQTEQHFNPTNNPTNGQSAFIGIYYLGNQTWINGAQLAPTVSAVLPQWIDGLPRGPYDYCGALFVNTHYSRLTSNTPLGAAINYVKCNVGQATQPGIFMKTPGKCPVIKGEIADIVIARTSNLQCDNLKNCLKLNPVQNPIQICQSTCTPTTTISTLNTNAPTSTAHDPKTSLGLTSSTVSSSTSSAPSSYASSFKSSTRSSSASSSTSTAPTSFIKFSASSALLSYTASSAPSSSAASVASSVPSSSANHLTSSSLSSSGSNSTIKTLSSLAHGLTSSATSSYSSSSSSAPSSSSSTSGSPSSSSASPSTSSTPSSSSSLPFTPTISSPPSPCSGHGAVICNCDFGYTGVLCETPINWCEELVHGAEDRHLKLGDLCEPFGYCMSTPSGGAQCVCNHGFSGDVCDIPVPNQTWIGERCALYSTSQVINNNLPVGCPNAKWDGTQMEQHCVPDNMDCFYLHCPFPVGWCLPTYGDSFFRTLSQMTTQMKKIKSLNP